MKKLMKNVLQKVNSLIYRTFKTPTIKVLSRMPESWLTKWNSPTCRDAHIEKIGRDIDEDDVSEYESYTSPRLVGELDLNLALANEVSRISEIREFSMKNIVKDTEDVKILRNVKMKNNDEIRPRGTGHHDG